MNDRIGRYKKQLEDLEDVTKFTLQVIFSFFDLLSSYSSTNKMHSRNIAIVMGPIMMLRKTSPSLDMSLQNDAIEIVEFIINHYQPLFSVPLFFFK